MIHQGNWLKENTYFFHCYRCQCRGLEFDEYSEDDFCHPPHDFKEGEWLLVFLRG